MYTEYRAVAELMEYKANEQTGLIEGYASTYNLDLSGDKIAPGAFAQTIADRKGKIPLLKNHDMDEWVGHTTSLAEDGKGLRMNAKLFLDTTGGRDTHAMLKALMEMDVRPGLSIGFNTKLSEWEGNTRILKEIELWEASITPFPAQPRAFVDGVKSVRDLEQALHAFGYSKADARRICAIAKDFQIVTGGMPGAVIERNRRIYDALRLRA